MVRLRVSHTKVHKKINNSVNQKKGELKINEEPRMQQIENKFNG
jgi:hypothetical protein